MKIFSAACIAGIVIVGSSVLLCGTGRELPPYDPALEAFYRTYLPAMEETISHIFYILDILEDLHLQIEVVREWSETEP